MEKKKIAFFISSYFDGIGVNTLRLAEQFSKQGYHVDLLIVKNEIDLINKNTNINIIDFKKNSAYKSIYQLVNYIKKHEPDVLISGGEAPNIVLILVKLYLFNKNFKTIVSIRTHLTTQYKHTKTHNQTVLKYLGKVFYRFADEIVAVSKGVAEDVSELFFIRRDRIKVIYNPIVNNEMLKLSEERVDHPWIVDKQVPVILGAGRLAKQKNFPLLINAFSIIKNEIDAKLIILGEGEARGKLEKLIKEEQLNESVDLVGYEPNPYKYMKNSDVFVLSSEWEGFGNVIVEAMACGAKVVSRDCYSGPAEILKNGEYGILIKENNPQELAKGIMMSIKKDNIERTKNIKRANKYSTKSTMYKYEQLINRKS